MLLAAFTFMAQKLVRLRIKKQLFPDTAALNKTIIAQIFSTLSLFNRCVLNRYCMRNTCTLCSSGQYDRYSTLVTTLWYRKVSFHRNYLKTRIQNHYCIFWDIFVNNYIRTNFSIVSNFDFPENLGSRCNINIVSYYRCTSFFSLPRNTDGYLLRNIYIFPELS